MARDASRPRRRWLRLPRRGPVRRSRAPQPPVRGVRRDRQRPLGRDRPGCSARGHRRAAPRSCGTRAPRPSSRAAATAGRHASARQPPEPLDEQLASCASYAARSVSRGRRHRSSRKRGQGSFEGVAQLVECDVEHVRRPTATSPPVIADDRAPGRRARDGEREHRIGVGGGDERPRRGLAEQRR